MQATEQSKWIKPVLLILNTNLTLDPGQSCASQGKLGTTADGITGNDGGSPGSTACGS